MRQRTAFTQSCWERRVNTLAGRTRGWKKKQLNNKSASPRGRMAHPPAPHLSRGGGAADSAARAADEARGVCRPRLAARVLGDGALSRMCFIAVNNDPEYCLGLPYLRAVGTARCSQPSRKRQRFIESPGKAFEFPALFFFPKTPPLHRQGN